MSASKPSAVTSGMTSAPTQPSRQPPPLRPFLASDGPDDFSSYDLVIRIRVGGEIFQVERGRLMLWSPVLRQMVKDLKPGKNNPISITDEGDTFDIELPDNPRHFEHFLWLLRADRSIVWDFVRDSASRALFLPRWFGIAVMAHKYQAKHPEEFSTYQLFGFLGDWIEGRDRKRFQVRSIIVNLLKIFQYWDNDGVQCERARALMRHTLYRRAHRPARWMTEDVADTIVALEEHGEMELAAQAYYYLLAYRSPSWISDARLRPVDRQRLLCGFYALSQAEIIGVGRTEEYDFALNEDLAIRGLQLWDLFAVDRFRLLENTQNSA